MFLVNVEKLKRFKVDKDVEFTLEFDESEFNGVNTGNTIYRMMSQFNENIKVSIILTIKTVKMVYMFWVGFKISNNVS